MWRANKLSDVKVCIAEHEWNCHRIVLATTGYFERLVDSSFADSTARCVTLDADTDAVAFGALVEFLYVGKCQVPLSKLADILTPWVELTYLVM